MTINRFAGLCWLCCAAGRCGGFDPADGFTGREAHFGSGYRFSPMQYR
jgi:hypothetical protein